MFKLFILLISLSINSVFSMESPGASDEELNVQIDYPKEEVIDIPWDKFYLHNFVKVLPDIEFDINSEQVIKDLIKGYSFLGVRDQQGNTPFLLAVKGAVELEEKFVTEQSSDCPNEDLSRATLQKLNNLYKFIDIIMNNEGEVYCVIADNDGNTVFDISRKFYYKFCKDPRSRFIYVSWEIPGYQAKLKELAISRWAYERINKPIGGLNIFCKDYESRLLDYLIKSNGGNISNILLALLNQPEISKGNHNFSYTPNFKLSLIELVFYISIILEESIINKDIEFDKEISKFVACQKLLLYNLFNSDQVSIFIKEYKLGSGFNLFKRFVKAPNFFKLIKSLKEQQLNINDPKIILALDDLISLELLES